MSLSFVVCFLFEIVRGRSKPLGPGASPVLLSALDGVAASADTSALGAQRL